jgi:hypothetical protein
LQVAPPPQAFEPAQGSVWQVPPRQTWPAAQVVAPHGVPPELPAVPLPVPVAPATPLAPPTPLTLPAVPVTCPALPLGVPLVPALPAGK